MHFVLLGVHSPEVCPTSNAKTRDLMLQTAHELRGIAERTGGKICVGPYVNREHRTVIGVEADTADAVDRFLVETRLHQWNSVRVLPSLPIEEGLKDVQEGASLF